MFTRSLATFSPTVMFLVSLLAATATNAAAAIPASERAALIALFNSTNGPGWSNNANWNGAPGNECGWYGIGCDVGGTTVTTVSLSGNKLKGTIPAALGNLTNLKFLYLGVNQLGGSIPATLGSLSSLQQLDLNSNQLSGSLPAALGNLGSLQELRLFSNQLSGAIPPELGNMSNLQILYLHGGNQVSGSIPATLGSLSNLQQLDLSGNRLVGSMPASLGNLSNLQSLYLAANQLSGAIPLELGNLSNLKELGLFENQLSGSIPAALGNLSSLLKLDLATNQLSGAIPPELGNLSQLKELGLAENRLSGSIPPELGNLSSLQGLALHKNQLSGAIPEVLGNLSNLQLLVLFENELSGVIPVALGNLSGLKLLLLNSNHLSGAIPSSLGGLTGLNVLWLDDNGLTGEIPLNFASLTSLNDEQEELAGLNLSYNGVFTSSANLRAFLDTKQAGTTPFESLQTLPPTGVSAAATSPTSVRADWTPIEYQAGTGGYRVEIATSPNGQYSLATTTADKTATSVSITGLEGATQYFIRLSTVTFKGSSQKNTVTSSTTSTVTVTTQPSLPSVVLIDTPDLLSVVADGSSTTSTSYTLSNVGQSSTQIQLTQTGSFFTQSPTSFVLAAGTTQRVTITSLPQASATAFRGSSTPAGNGVPSSIVVPVSLIAAAPPNDGDPQVIVLTRRVDVSGPSNTNPSGSVTFKNIGTAAATGLLFADVPWIEPDPAIITIAAGEERSASFTVNRARRPDAGALAGTVSATLSFVYVTRGTVPGKSPYAGSPTLVAPVTVGDTVPPVVAPGGIPFLNDGEIGLVIPGVGNITGSVGVFISDISIGNALSGLLASDLKLYYLSNGTVLTATQPVAAGSSVNLADVVSTVFGKTEQNGVLHVRSSLATQLGVNASVFNKSGATGTFGTAIPVFQTNRALAKGESLMLTGLRKSATSHTNLYLQEVSGTLARADLRFLDATGQTLGELADQSVLPFGTLIIGQTLVPEGSITAIVSNDGDGSLVAYATPVDKASGDTWAVADWNRFFGRTGAEEQVIPVAGSAPGRNNTYFRTDISIANPGTASATGTLRYYQQSPVVAVVDKSVTIEPAATLSLDDVVVNFFNQAAPSLGHVELIPSSGSFAMTSRTYTTVPGTSQTFGTGVPVLTRTDSLRIGQAKVIGGLKDSTAATTNAARPASFRTNVGLVETEGKSLTVRISVLFFDGRSLAIGGEVAAKTYGLAPHEFRQLNTIVAEIIGPTRESEYGDLDNVQVRVEVTGGEGGLMVYASATDNGSGDTVLRIE